MKTDSRFVYDDLSWTSAKANCEKLGGTLFYKLDGTTEQLDQLIERFEIITKVFSNEIIFCSDDIRVSSEEHGTVF